MVALITDALLVKDRHQSAVFGAGNNFDTSSIAFAVLPRRSRRTARRLFNGWGKADEQL